MAPHGAGRTAWRVHEDRIHAGGANRRRLKIGADAMNFHSRASSGVGEPAQALVACVTGENPRSRRFESDRFPSGRGAGVVDQLAARNGCETTNESVGGILDDEGAFGEAGKIARCRVSGARCQADA